MSRLSYETAETLLYDPVAGNRAATRTSLYNLGFRRIESVGELATLAECLQSPAPDLAICEAQGAERELCQLIQSLRQGLAGFNPFLVTMVTAWDKSGSTVRRILDSGADDLLLRPFSAARLEERIAAHVERRKGFVITSDYVGPDRRSDGRASSVELFKPPNSLKMKALEGLSPDEAEARLHTELKSARRTLSLQKLKRDAFQLCVLSRLLRSGANDGERHRADRGKLAAVARSIALRCAGTEFESAVPSCEAALAAVEGLEVGVEQGPALQMLGHAVMGVDRVLSPDETTAERIAEIDVAVALIHARTAPALAS